MIDKDHIFFIKKTPKDEEDYQKILEEELLRLKFKELPCPQKIPKTPNFFKFNIISLNDKDSFSNSSSFVLS